jgi:membrane fusion protein (multidrug efflux system)
MRRHTSLIAIIAVLSLLLLYVLYESFLGKSAIKPKAAYQLLVTTEQASTQAVQDAIESLGTTSSNEAVLVSATVMAKIQRLHFDDGARVEKGAVLVELDAAAQHADVEEQRANLVEEERKLQHLQTLVARKAVSQSDFDKQQSMANAARARLEAIQAKLQDYTLVAPFSGVLGARRVSVGALVSPGTVITTLDDLSRVKVDFSVPEKYLPQLHEGLAVQVQAQAYPGRVFVGVISFVDSRIDPVTRAISLRAHLDNQEQLLRPGMLLHINIAQPERNALMLPERSIAPLRSDQFVFVLDAPNAEGKIIAHKRKVTLGLRTNGRVEILSGVTAGDTVVVDGSMSLQDGMAVKVQQKTDAADAGKPVPAKQE